MLEARIRSVGDIALYEAFASVPIAARVSHLVGQRENKNNFLIMHAMGPNLAGVFGTAISGGIMLALLGG